MKKQELEKEEKLAELDRFEDDCSMAVSRLSTLRSQITSVKSVAESWQKGRMKESFRLILADPEFQARKDHITLRQGIHAKSCGINFSDINFTCQDKDLDLEKCKAKVEKGGQNSVDLLVYKDGRKGMFKEEQYERIDSGIVRNVSRGGNRNLATNDVASLLGSKVIVKSNLILYGDKLGLLMDVAPGSTLWRSSTLMGKITKEMLPELHRQLNELEWCDMLCGQTDRNGSNVMMEVSPQGVRITGIDNDLSFGKESKSLGGMQSGGAFRSGGKPKLIGQAVYDKLIGLDFDKDVFPLLQGRLIEEEIESTRNRLKELQEHAKSLHPDYVVEKWEEWKIELEGKVYDASGYLALETSKRSYGSELQDVSIFRRNFAGPLKKLYAN